MTQFAENCHFKPLFLQSYCVLSVSALVERVFSQSRLILRSNRVNWQTVHTEIIINQKSSY